MKKPIVLPNINGLDVEPWVQIDSNEQLSGWDKNDEIRYNQQNRQIWKARFYQFVFDYMTNSDVNGDYHEYGCHKARTFRMALSEAEKHSINDMNFYAFDSFEGLPDSKENINSWTKGALNTSEEVFMSIIKEHGLYIDKVKCVKGFYNESLTTKLQEQFMSEQNKIALATLDCDLYDSSVSVLDFIEPLLQEGSVLYFDDAFPGHNGTPFQGMLKAMIEFESRSKWGLMRFMDIGWWGRSYIVYDKNSQKTQNINWL